jgi:Rrf2 family protein
MLSNSRYTVAIHILTLLAYNEAEALTSEFIASSVNTNPVVIRRILASLRKAGIVSSQGGPGGGWCLAERPEQVTLRHIYRIMNPDALFPLHPAEPNQNCPVGRSIQELLTKRFVVAQRALEDSLGAASIADLVKEVS